MPLHCHSEPVYYLATAHIHWWKCLQFWCYSTACVDFGFHILVAYFWILPIICVGHWHPQIVVPPLPGKALKRQLPFRGDEGLFEESFIEERRSGLEQFINRSVCASNNYSTIAFHRPPRKAFKTSNFCLLSVCVYVSVELQVTPWPRTSAVFTCFCKRKSLTVTTFLEKYDTRVVEGCGG